MRLYLINPNNPLVSLAKVKQSRWNRYRVWKPLGLLVLAGLTPPEWEITVIDENLRAADYSAMPPPGLGRDHRLHFPGQPGVRGGEAVSRPRREGGHGRDSRHHVQ